MRERIRIRSMVDVLREQERRGRSIRSGGNPLRNSVGIGGLSTGQSWHNRPEPDSGGFNVQDHVFKKPTAERRPMKFLSPPEIGRIIWEIEVHEDYDPQGRLRVILQFSGIEFTDASVFERSKRDYGPDGRVFYSPVKYKKDRAFLILATYGDIFESQVVATEIDEGPFFREEILLPQLTETHDPTSMAVYGKNHLVVVGYNRLCMDSGNVPR